MLTFEIPTASFSVSYSEEFQKYKKKFQPKSEKRKIWRVKRISVLAGKNVNLEPSNVFDCCL